MARCGADIVGPSQVEAAERFLVRARRLRKSNGVAMPYTNPDAGRPAAPAPFGSLADGCAAPSRQDVAAGRGGRLHWRAGLARFERPRVSRALLDLATSVLPYLALAARAGLPPVPQSRRDVRDWPHLRAAGRAAPRLALGARAHQAQRDWNQRRAGAGRRRAVLDVRMARLPAGADAPRAARGRGGSLAVLRPAPVRGHL